MIHGRACGNIISIETRKSCSKTDHNFEHNGFVMALKPAFCYSPLDSSFREISVLNIHPGSPSNEIILTFDIIRIEADSNLDFGAVSYRWGSPEGEHQILLDDQLLIVTSSQMKMIQDPYNLNRIRRVWIDAVCINQKNVAERNRQVQLLQNVFCNSQCARIWLNHQIYENNRAYQNSLHSVLDVHLNNCSKRKQPFGSQSATFLA